MALTPYHRIKLGIAISRAVRNNTSLFEELVPKVFTAVKFDASEYSSFLSLPAMAAEMNLPLEQIQRMYASGHIRGNRVANTIYVSRAAFKELLHYDTSNMPIQEDILEFFDGETMVAVTELAPLAVACLRMEVQTWDQTNTLENPPTFDLGAPK